MNSSKKSLIRRAAAAFFVLVGLSSFGQAQLQSAPWPKAHANTLNSGVGLGSGASGVLYWKSSNGSSGPAVSELGSIYLQQTINAQNYLVSLNAKTGVTNWTILLSGTVSGTPAIGRNGTIYVGLSTSVTTGGVSAYTDNGTSASLKWAYSGVGAVNGSPTIDSNGKIYFGANDNYLYAITDAGSSATTAWSYETGSEIVSTPAVGSDGTIYVTSYDKNLYSINPSNGTPNWHFTTGGPISSDPVVGSDGSIYITSIDKNLYSINSAGTMNWSATLGESLSTPAIGQNSTIYVANGVFSPGPVDNQLIAVNTSTGVVNWTFASTAFGNNPNIDVASDGTIYFAADQLYAVTDGGTQGTKAWSYAGAGVAGFAIGSDGTIYLPTVSALLAVNSTLMSFSLAQNVIQGQTPVQATIQLSSSAIASKDNVVYFSSNNSAVVVPGNKSIYNTTAAHFNVQTSQVTTPQTATVTATLLGQSIQQTLTVYPAPALNTVTFSPATVQGGQRTIMTVTLMAPTIGVTVDISSMSPDAVPAANTLVFPQGASSESVVVHTNVVSASEEAEINAIIYVGNNGNGIGGFFNITAPTITAVALSPTVVQGGNSGKIGAYMNGPAGSFTIMDFSSNNSAVVPLSTGVFISQGATEGSTTYTTNPVSVTTQVTLSVSLGSTVLNTTLTVNPPLLSGISVAPNPAEGGLPTALAVYLTGRTGTGGMSVTLSSNLANATIAGSATIAAGTGSLNVPIQTVAVDTPTPVTITATMGPTTLTTNFTINPAALNRLQIVPTSLTGGQTGKVAVYLDGNAGPSGTVVTLTSNNAAVTIPSSVKIPTGTTSANVTVTSTSVTSPTVVTITATVGSVTLQGQITVNPSQ